jgi:hypothetical protein
MRNVNKIPVGKPDGKDPGVDRRIIFKWDDN